MDWFTLIILVILTSILIFYLYVKWSFTYWKRRGAEYIAPEFPFGNTKSFMKKELSLGDQFTIFYKEFKSRGVVGGGVYVSFNPMFVVVDLELAKNIVQTDFNHFVNHGIYVNEEDDPLSGNLFALEDERWKYLRTKLTPTFTSGKMKLMFQTMAACADGLIDVLNDHSLIQDPLDIKDVVSRYTTDVIGSCAFGIECNSLKNPCSEFRQYGKKINEPDFISRIKSLIPFCVPLKILRALHFKLTNSDVEKFFMEIVKKTIEYRETNNIHRKDFMHLLLQLKNRGKLVDDEKFEIRNSSPNTNSEEKLTINELAAQCFLFFIAGFETSATTMTFALLELAMNQDIQDKLRNEIQTVIEKHGEQISYDAVMEMSYLNKVVFETLRKHPPFPILPRICNKSYPVPGTDIVLEPGTFVQIPTHGIQRDPEYYPNPEKFDPERFNDEAKSQRHPLTFLAFGEGPRNCIGSRFGLLQTKVGLLNVIRHFKVTLNNKTKTPIKYYSTNIVTTVEGHVWLNVSKLY